MIGLGIDLYLGASILTGLASDGEAGVIYFIGGSILLRYTSIIASGLIFNPKTDYIKQTENFLRYLEKYNRKHKTNYILLFTKIEKECCKQIYHYKYFIADKVDFVKNFKLYSYKDYKFYREVLNKNAPELLNSPSLDRNLILRSVDNLSANDITKLITLIKNEYPNGELNDVIASLKYKIFEKIDDIQDFCLYLKRYPIVDIEIGYKYIKNFKDAVTMYELCPSINKRLNFRIKC